MKEFEQFLDELERLAQLTLEVITKYKSTKPQKGRKYKKLDIVEYILAKAGKPLHITEIINIANKEFRVALDRDSLASALSKSMRKGARFTKTAPNTFAVPGPQNKLDTIINSSGN